MHESYIRGEIITRWMPVRAFHDQIFIQVQLTLIFPPAFQRDGLGERIIGQRCDIITFSWEFASIMNNGQNNSGIPGHVYFTLELRVIVTGEVKEHGV